MPDDFSAEFVGDMACRMVEVAVEKGLVTKNNVGVLRRRAEALRTDGIRVTARYEGAKQVIQPFILTPDRHIKDHELERKRIAIEFTEIEDELLRGKRRGRPIRKIPTAKDFTIIIAALRSLAEARATESRSLLSKQFNAALRREIEKSDLPSRGEGSEQHLKIHLQRLRRQTPSAVRLLGLHLQNMGYDPD